MIERQLVTGMSVGMMKAEGRRGKGEKGKDRRVGGGMMEEGGTMGGAGQGKG